MTRIKLLRGDDTPENLDCQAPIQNLTEPIVTVPLLQEAHYRKTGSVTNPLFVILGLIMLIRRNRYFVYIRRAKRNHSIIKRSTSPSGGLVDFLLKV